MKNKKKRKKAEKFIIYLYAHAVRNSDLNYQITLGDRKGTLNRNVTSVRNIRCQPLISLTYN
jgi:hypothetical protein